MSALTLPGTAADLTILASREITHAVNPLTDSQNKTRTAFKVIGYTGYFIEYGVFYCLILK